MTTDEAIPLKIMRLSFADKNQESNFLTAHYQKAVITTRFSIVLIAFAYCLLRLFEIFIGPLFAESISQVRGITHTDIIIAWLTGLLLLTYTRFYLNHWTVLTLAAVLITNGGIILITEPSLLVGNVANLFGLLLTIMWLNLLSGVRFRYSLVANLLTIVVFNSLLIGLKDFSALLLLKHNLLLLGATTFGGIACYRLEELSRQAFLQQQSTDSMSQQFTNCSQRLQQQVDEKSESMQTMSAQFASSSETLQKQVDDKTQELQDTLTELREINTSYNRFVPRDFLKHLGKDSIVNVELGNHTLRDMSVLFADIYAFTTLSESMSPKENFDFLNSYLSQIGPVIRENDGFIDKYIGDGIMAIFDKQASDAVAGGVAILEKLKVYNEGRKRAGYVPISIGIGINTGNLMLGTIGEHHRMESTVISDTVNLASRIQGMTRLYSTPLLISDDTFQQFDNPAQFATRIVDRVIAQGRTEAVTIREVFNADPPAIKEAKYKTADIIGRAFSRYHGRNLKEAAELFRQSLDIYPQDTVAKIYYERCQYYLRVGMDEDWDGVTVLDTK